MDVKHKRKIVLNARQLRNPSTAFRARGIQRKINRNEIYIVLDNVLDTYNIGSIFRLADAVAAKKIFLCGGTETPPNHRIKKASINTTEVVEWEYCESALDAIRKLTIDNGQLTKKISNLQPKARLDKVGKCQMSNVQIVAIEQSTKSVLYDKFKYKLPICLIVGNETTGVSKEALKMADGIVELPMFGVNKSLNVMVSLGIVLYKVVECLP